MKRQMQLIKCCDNNIENVACTFFSMRVYVLCLVKNINIPELKYVF